MNADNFVRALGPFFRRKPFRPFAIEFVTGELLPITHPELLELHGDLIVHMDPHLRYRVFDSASVCQVLDPPAK